MSKYLNFLIFESKIITPLEPEPIEGLRTILIREKRDYLYNNAIKFIHSRVELDLASFTSDIWSH